MKFTSPFGLLVLTVSALDVEAFHLPWLRGNNPIDQKIHNWKAKHCKIATYRRHWGHNENGDCGDWNFYETRHFYITELDRALDSLETSGIPSKNWGFLAVEHRETIKNYARERSHLIWRVLALVIGREPRSVEEYEADYRKKLDTEGMTEEEIKNAVSLFLVESARKTRESVNYIFHVLGFVELCLDEPKTAWMLTYEELMSIFLLPEDIPGLLPGFLRKNIRDSFPDCKRKFGWTMSRHPEWKPWLGQLAPLFS